VKLKKLNVAGAKRIIETILELQGPWAVVEWANLRRDDEKGQHLLVLKCAFQSLREQHVSPALAVAREIIEISPSEEKLQNWIEHRQSRRGGA
jgi:hypothetical protein